MIERRLFSFYANGNAGNYHVTMTSDDDPAQAYLKHKCILPQTREEEHQCITFKCICQTAQWTYVWIDRNDHRGMSTQMDVYVFSNIFIWKNTLEILAEMSEISAISDSYNFTPSLFRSLCEIIGDCFDVLVLAPSEKYLSPKQSPPVSQNDLKKDGAHLLLSN